MEAYGKIENQTVYSNHSGYATDDKACLTAKNELMTATPIVNSTVWDNIMKSAGPHATFYNRYYDADGPYSNSPSGDKLKIKIEDTGSSYGSHKWLRATITATCKTLPAVAFSWVANGDIQQAKQGTIVLKDGESTAFVFGDAASIDLYQQSCYTNSSGSILGSTTSSFVTISKEITSWLSNPFYVKLDAVYPSKNSKNYGFLMDANGNITNSNQKVSSSFCYCTMKFQRPDARFTKLRITYTQDSEASFDYGQFSKIDKLLCAYPVGDTATSDFGTDVVQHSCKGESNTERVITYDISSLTVGTNHFINFKYHKDSSVDRNTDTFKISKIEFVEDCEYAFAYSSIKNTYGLTVRNNGKAMVEFSWH